MMDIQLRLANEGDITIFCPWIQQLHSHEQHDTQPLHTNIESNLVEWFKQLLKDRNSLIIMAEADHSPIGGLIGSITLSGSGLVQNPLMAKVDILWVEQAFRGHQVANKLVDVFENSAREMGVPYVECSHTISNKDAEGFWLHQGYQSTAVTRRKTF